MSQSLTALTTAIFIQPICAIPPTAVSPICEMPRSVASTWTTTFDSCIRRLSLGGWSVFRMHRWKVAGHRLARLTGKPKRRRPVKKVGLHIACNLVFLVTFFRATQNVATHVPLQSFRAKLNINFDSLIYHSTSTIIACTYQDCELHFKKSICFTDKNGTTNYT